MTGQLMVASSALPPDPEGLPSTESAELRRVAVHGAAGSSARVPVRRPPLWGELIVIAVLLWGYDEIEGLAPTRGAAAFAHGTALLTLERSLHLSPERYLNVGLVRAGTVVEYAANYYYAVLHFAVTLVVLGWLYLRRPAHYRWWRTVLIAVNAVALVVFWLYPVAPPRLVGGFVDTVVDGHTLGSWGSPETSSADVYAAMPSLHVAWALWCALAVAAAAHHRFTRRVTSSYPLLTAVVVMATANHYLLDTVAAAAVVALAVAVVAAGRAAARHVGAGRVFFGGARAARPVDDGPAPPVQR